MITTNKVALTRTLTKFAQHLGLSGLMSSAAAQVFLQTNNDLLQWDIWLRENCEGCRHQPESCSWFNPPDDQRPPGVTRDQFTEVQVVQIEIGRIRSCPRKE